MLIFFQTVSRPLPPLGVGGGEKEGKKNDIVGSGVEVKSFYLNKVFFREI